MDDHWIYTVPRYDHFRCLVLVASFAMVVVAGGSNAEDGSNWPHWRGILGTGVAPNSKPPIEWGQSKNVRWKTPLPGRGHSTPIVFGQTVFVTTATPVGPTLPPRMSGRPGEHDNLPIESEFAFSVIAIERQSGAILWERVVRRAIPIEAGHNTGSLASASPTTDGKRLYAHFGSHGLYCFDFEGNLIWSKNFGQMHSKHGHGEGASPALGDRSLIINWDHEQKSFVAAIDSATGNEIWRRDRKEDTSWSSPIVIDQNGIKQVVVCGTNRVRGYALESGDVLWECGGMSSNIVATPVFAKGILYVGSSYEKRILMAIDLRNAKGDLTNSKHVLWQRTRGTPYVPSMLLVHEHLYFLSHYQNVLTRVHGPTGKDAPGSIRLGSLGDIYASPVSANGYVYVTDRNGTTEVITDSDLPRTVSVNRLEENVNASLAILGNSILIRGEQHLYCIGESTN